MKAITYNKENDTPIITNGNIEWDKIKCKNAVKWCDYSGGRMKRMYYPNSDFTTPPLDIK